MGAQPLHGENAVVASGEQQDRPQHDTPIPALGKCAARAGPRGTELRYRAQQKGAEALDQIKPRSAKDVVVPPATMM